MTSTPDTDEPVLSWPECARLCKSAVALPHTSIAFVWGPSDHVLRRFFQSSALPHLRRVRIEAGFVGRGPGELFLGLAERGRALEELIVTTYLDLGRRRCVRFTLLFDDAGVPFSQYECLGEPLLEGELQDAAESMGVPQPVIAAPGSPRRSETERA